VNEAAWIPCPECEDMLCVIHGMHVYDCPCPDIEEWVEKAGRLPYEPGSEVPW